MPDLEKGELHQHVGQPERGEVAGHGDHGRFPCSVAGEGGGQKQEHRRQDERHGEREHQENDPPLHEGYPLAPEEPLELRQRPQAQEAMEVRRVVGDGREVEQFGLPFPGRYRHGIGNGLAQRPFLRAASGLGTRSGPGHRIPVVGAEPPHLVYLCRMKRGAPRNHGKSPPAVDRDDPIRGGHKSRGRELGPDRAEDFHVLPRGGLEPPRKREESALPEASERRPDSLAREEERLAGRMDPERGKGRRGNVRRLDEVEYPAVPGEEVARPFFPDLYGKRSRPSPREPGEVLADQSHEFLRGLHDRQGRGNVRRGRQHPFRPPEAELEDPRMFKKPVRENAGKKTEIRGGRPSSVLRDDSALLSVREQCCLRRDLPRETEAQPRRAVDPGGEDRPVITRYSGAGCDLPRPRQVPTAARSL